MAAVPRVRCATLGYWMQPRWGKNLSALTPHGFRPIFMQPFPSPDILMVSGDSRGPGIRLDERVDGTSRRPCAGCRPADHEYGRRDGPGMPREERSRSLRRTL